jgi:hypothetical protein
MADEQKHLSQDDIDALIGDIAGPAPVGAKPDIASPSLAASSLIGQAKEPGHLPTAIAGTPHGQGQDEAERLLNKGQEPAQPHAVLPPAAKPLHITKSLGQAEIDALINQVGQAAAKGETPRPLSKGTHVTKSLGQAEIDALINQVQDATDRPGTSPQPKSSALTKSVQSQTSSAKVAHVTKGLGQDEIDALINQVQDPGEKPSTDPVSKGSGPLTKSPTQVNKNAPVADKGATASDKANRGIDHLLASVESQAHQKAQNQITGSDGRDISASGPLAQDDIDRLLAELGAATPSKDTTGRTAKPSTERAPSRPATSNERAPNRPATSKTSAPMVKPQSAPHAAPTTGVPAGGAATVALSAADLEALVTKQSGIESDHSEAPMIDQGDIDALVKQLANATGAPDTKRISDALAQHEGEIDKLLEKAANANSTMDAVEITRSTPPSGGRAVAIGAPSMAVVTAHELHGTRWLLAAAVLFLGMCSTTLIIVVNSINSLSHELHEGHHATLTPTDSFGDDLKAALAKLNSEDDGEVTKGVLYLQRLKIRHPSHLADIALTLARHFRAHGAHRQAIDEYVSLSDNATGPFDDPRIYLDYANSLVQVGELAMATKQVYLLLANEDAYLGDHDRRGLARPADEVARNRQAVQDAYLSLGQLIVSDSQVESVPSAKRQRSEAATHPAAAIEPAAGAMIHPPGDQPVAAPASSHAPAPAAAPAAAPAPVLAPQAPPSAAVPPGGSP